MYTSIRAELQKARRRHDLIVCLLVPVMALLWCQSAAPTGADELALDHCLPCGRIPFRSGQYPRSK